MDILYVVGTGSQWDNNELRYSLRSIAKFGRNVGRVFLVGTKPDFVSSNVVFLPYPDKYIRKHKNIMTKVLAAVEKTNIDSHFLISSDDHFYIHEVDFDNYPVYFRDGEIPESFPETKRSMSYFASLLETRSLLLKYSLPIYKTNPHCNTHFRKDLYLRNRYLFEEAMKLEHGGEMNCIMGNLMINEGVVPMKYRDSKLTDQKYKDKELFAQRIEGVNCISMDDMSLSFGMGEYLKAMFPEKCKYEI